jgi:phage tail sheath protein FI
MSNFSVSPGVNVNEIDLTGIIPALSTSIGAFAGKFQWGPVDEVSNLSDEKELARYYGVPTKELARSYHTAASFLKYSNTLLVSRGVNDDARNASSGETDGYSENFLIKNLDQYESGTADSYSANFYAKYPGAFGNSLKVVVQAAGAQTKFPIEAIAISGTDVVLDLSDDAAEIAALGSLADGVEISITGVRSSGDLITVLENTRLWLGDVTASGVAGTVEATLYTDAAQTTEFDATGYSNTTFTSDQLTSSYVTTADAVNIAQAFSTRPGTSSYAASYGVSNDEMHIIVVDEDGKFSGVPGTILERFGNVSGSKDVKNVDGSTAYYKDVINSQSAYILADNLSEVLSSGADTVIREGGVTYAIQYAGSVYSASFTGGADGDIVSNDGVYDAIELFEDAESIDINLVFAEADVDDELTIARKLIYMAEARKDCLALISADVGIKDLASDDAKLDAVIAKFDSLPSSSYAAFDSGPVQTYDKYNDEYIWIPSAGHIAGLCARTDDDRDPWWSPAGYQRGVLLGVSKLGFNPKKNHRDELYKSRVNSIVSFPGEGIILFGDKTAQSTASAFDRINVRRLFIVLEKAIATAAKRQLFEFNDDFTRAQFRNLVNPYLRDVQGRRGITEFRVVCDESNNTGEVVGSNRFVADIYIKPARAINFITLNFVATRADVEFDEIIGQF